MAETPNFLHHEDLYRRIVESSPAAVALLTNEPSSRVLYASPRIEELSGFTPQELIAATRSGTRGCTRTRSAA